MSKKEKILYMNHGKRWNVIVKHKIVIANHDTINIIRCNEKMIELGCVVLKRVTRKFRLFGWNVYFNTLFGGVEE